ncbi:MAG: sulfatase-like hydrolase/transferase, partial [Acutalibacteraceae bacterium]
MKRKLELDKGLKVFPMLLMIVGILIMLAQWIFHLNLVSVISMAFCCVMSLVILLSILIKSKVYLTMVIGYAAASFGNVLFHIIWGADAGFGAFSSGLAGFKSAEHPLLTGEGNFGTRLLGNLLLVLPCAICLWAIFFIAKKKNVKKLALQKAMSFVMSVLLIGTSIFYVLTANMRTKPNAQRLWEGQDDYLNGVDKNADSKSPNVLFILMDDLGYGDVSLNGSLIQTPNIDSIGENGLNFENFYSSYSVCSPSRFAAMTGRYPYRGYADNVCYPTIDTFSPFAATRIFNSIEMGGNADGMLGDEITIAETFKAAGYNTGAFGKWHLGDYGEYLPTNQGFDYFYGSHHVNDMTPFYHVKE